MNIYIYKGIVPELTMSLIIRYLEIIVQIFQGNYQNRELVKKKKKKKKQYKKIQKAELKNKNNKKTKTTSSLQPFKGALDK